MTEDRKEPTLSPLKPDPDDIVRHRQRTSRPQAGAQNGRGGSGQQRPVVVRSSKLVPFAFLLAVTGLGLAGFAYWQLLESNKVTEAAVARIAELEERLEMSGDESQASMATMQAKLKWADDEIRKLWGVSHDTNRKAIAENKNAIAAANKKVASAESRINSSANELRGEIRKLNDRLAAQQTVIDGVEQTRVQLQKQNQQVTDSLREMKQAQVAVQERVHKTEQAIDAFDTFRRAVNRDLLELKAQAGAGAGTTTP